jgi:radical SAM superfamily enzyme YgiQ (UPF0313 family)
MEKIVICDTGGSKTVLKVLLKNGEEVKTFNCVGFGKAQDSKEELKELADLINQIEDKECFITLFFYFYMIMMAILIKISDNENRDKLRKKDCYYD